eukprot:jgi/Tetstr1/437915/TSEL_026545.t1
MDMCAPSALVFTAAAAPPASAPELPSLQTVGLVPLPHALIINHFFGLCCGGTLSLLDGMLTAGFAVTRVTLCEISPVRRRWAADRLRMLSAEYPTQLHEDAFQEAFSSTPQDVTLITEDVLAAMPPVTLVAAGPCCEPWSSAGCGRGWEDMRSGVMAAVIRIVRHLADAQPASVSYIIENVPGALKCPELILSLGEPLIVNALDCVEFLFSQSAAQSSGATFYFGPSASTMTLPCGADVNVELPRTVGSRFEHEPFAVLNLDIWGPMAPSLHGRRWMIGANCRRTNVHLAGSLATQSEAAGAVDRFLAFARHKGFTVRQIRVDRAAVFLCSSLEKICKDANVDMQTDGADNAAVDIRQLPPLPSSPPLRRSTRIRSSTTDDSYVYYGTTKSSCPAAPAAVVDSVSLPSTLSQHDIPCDAVLGNHQRPGIDFDSTKLYAPVVSFVSIRILLALVVYLRRRIYNMDVTTAFLNAKVTEEIYIKLPRGMEEFSESGEPMVGRLLRALYGLRQSPGLWFTELDNYLKRNNFRQCTSDGCVYVQLVGTDGDFAAVAIYVDDIIILEAADPAWYPAFKTRLLAEFDCTDAGLCTWLMGMGLDWDDDDGFCARFSDRLP